MKSLESSYSDIMKMPTYERRYFLSLVKGQKEAQDEQNQNQNNIIQQGNHSRVRKVSGSGLKAMFQNGQIPNI